MKHSLFLPTILILSFLLAACTSSDDCRLEQALVFAGDNRGELEKVLTHYTNDSLKQAAARFLITNMIGHTGYDPAIIPFLRPVYQKHAAISEKYGWKRPGGWRKEIDELWNKKRVKTGCSLSREDILRWQSKIYFIGKVRYTSLAK